MCPKSIYINNNYDHDRSFVHYGSSNFSLDDFKMPVDWIFHDKLHGGLW